MWSWRVHDDRKCLYVRTQFQRLDPGGEAGWNAPHDPQGRVAWPVSNLQTAGTRCREGKSGSKSIGTLSSSHAVCSRLQVQDFQGSKPAEALNLRSVVRDNFFIFPCQLACLLSGRVAPLSLRPTQTQLAPQRPHPLLQIARRRLHHQPARIQSCCALAALKQRLGVRDPCRQHHEES